MLFYACRRFSRRGDKIMNSEELFLEKVTSDIRSFVRILDNCTDKKIVLLFPPINNFRRFLIHQVVKQVFCEANLKTLSVSKLDARRTIVYHNSIEENNVAPNHQNTSVLAEIRKLESPRMSKVPEARTRKSRKPDIQIYVPRGRRMLQTSRDSFSRQNQWTENVETYDENYSAIDLTTTESSDAKTKEDNFATCLCDIAENETTYPRSGYLDTPDTKATENRDVNSEKYDLSSFETIKCDSDFNASVKLDSLVENTVNHSSGLKPNSQNEILINPCDERKVTHFCETQNSQIIDLTNNESDDLILTNAITPNIRTTRTSNHEHEPDQSGDDSLTRESTARETINPVDASLRTENYRNDCMTSFASSSIEKVSSKSELDSSNKNKKLVKASECDWEELFDDSGELVNDNLIDELLKTMGRVRIKHAEQDYTTFQTAEERSSDGESIIEVHNFPADFKTDDLLAVFASYRTDQGFQIVWVDDTHALAVFSSPLLADQVLNRELPFVKTRPLKNALPKSRVKARNYVLAPATRPKTCVSLARRLVSGHLGMKISITDKQREAEKKLLSDAREKKRQIAKQKNDIWEDTSSSDK